MTKNKRTKSAKFAETPVANTYLALPKRLIRDKNEVILNPILALATSDGMKTDIAPKMLRKRLGT